MFIAVKIYLKWRNIILHPLYVESKKKWFKWTYLQNRKRLTDLENELMAAQGEEIVKEFGSFRDTLIYSKWITNKDLLLVINGTQLNVIRQPGWEKGLGDNEYMYVYVWVPVCVYSQSCLTACNPMDYCPPGSSVHRIFQARILEWVATPFSRVSPRPRNQTWVSHIASIFFTVWATRKLTKSLYQMQNKKFKVWGKKEYISI